MGQIWNGTRTSANRRKRRAAARRSVAAPAVWWTLPRPPQQHGTACTSTSGAEQGGGNQQPAFGGGTGRQQGACCGRSLGCNAIVTPRRHGSAFRHLRCRAPMECPGRARTPAAATGGRWTALAVRRLSRRVGGVGGGRRRPHAALWARGCRGNRRISAAAGCRRARRTGGPAQPQPCTAPIEVDPGSAERSSNGGVNRRFHARR